MGRILLPFRMRYTLRDHGRRRNVERPDCEKLKQGLLREGTVGETRSMRIHTGTHLTRRQKTWTTCVQVSVGRWIMVRNMPSEEKCICSECVGEPFLRDSIRSRGKEARCSYCEKQGATIRISEMADAVDAALDQHFSRTPTEPSNMEYLWFKETGDWDRAGENQAPRPQHRDCYRVTLQNLPQRVLGRVLSTLRSGSLTRCNELCLQGDAELLLGGRFGGPPGIRTPDQGIMSTQGGSDWL